MAAGTEYFLLFFAGFLYWPLFIARLAGIYRRFMLDKKKIAVSVAGSFAAAFVTYTFIVKEAYLGSYFLLATAASVVPVAMILAMPEKSKTRTKAKLLVLAAYFHIVWQMLPAINVVLLVTEIIVTTCLLIAASYRRRKRPLLYKTSEISIGDTWK